MMFKPEDKAWAMDSSEVRLVTRWLREPLTSKDILWEFKASPMWLTKENPLWLTMVNVTKGVDNQDGTFYKVSRTYIPARQRNEIILDMFDISQTHRIIGVKYPFDFYLTPCDSEHPDTNIDADLIEMIVGKVEG